VAKHFNVAASCCAVGVLAWPLAVPAQETSNESSDKLETIVVSARRIEEDIQKVPVTISAFDAAALKEAQISTPMDLQYSTPGVFFSGTSSRASPMYAIRGQSRPLTGNGAPAVVTYFSDIPLPTFVSAVPQFDLQSMQVLKGPQGTLFGRNTSAGAILIYPQAPTYRFGGYVEGSAGNYDLRTLEGAVNIPIVDEKAALRIGGRIERRDGNIKNIENFPDLQNLHGDYIRASLLLQPADWLTNTAIYDYNRQPYSKVSATGTVLVRVDPSNPYLVAEFARQRANGFFTSGSDFPTREGYRTSGVSNKTVIDFGGPKLTNIFGLRQVSFATNNSGDAVPLKYVDAMQVLNLKQYTEEIQLAGQALDRRLNWLLGGFYLESKPHGPNALHVDIFRDVFAPGVLPNTPASYAFNREKSKALFANATYALDRILQGLTFNVGARYTWDDFFLCSGTGELDPPFRFTSSDCPGRIPDGSAISGSSSKPTWTLGFDYQATDDLFLFLTSRRGYKAGGLNGPKLGSGLAAFQTFAPEITTDFELGAKSTIRAGDWEVRLNGSVFRSYVTDLQQVVTGVSTANFQGAGLACLPPTFTPFIDGDCNPANDPQGTALTINAGKLRTTGLELQSVIAPTDSFSVTLGATFINAKASSFDIPPILARVAPPDLGTLYTPKRTFTADVRYVLPFARSIGEVVFNANYYKSSSFELVGYTAQGYNLVNARLDWNEIFGSRVNLGAFARNLFNEEYVSGPAITALGLPLTSIIPGDPRAYGVQMRVEFGKK
jgi:iron complex outermembrane receptor protein